jgi:hypothetical protein
MKKNILRASLLAIVGSFSSSTYAANQVTTGKPLEVFADPSDVVVGLDKPGPCGSAFFHIQRANENFKELTAVVLTAYASGKSLRLVVDDSKCSGTRNVIVVGSVF